MIDGNRVLAVIPARGGSKGVRRKNLRPIGGKPLIAWTIETAKQSKYIDRLVLSSEDMEIIAIARQWAIEVPFIRPAELAADHVSGLDVFAHALKMLPGYDIGVLLQPTSPLRSTSDIDGCVEACVEHNADTAISVTEVSKSPYWMYMEGQDGFLRPLIDTPYSITQRQDLPRAFCPNGAVFVARCNYFLKAGSFQSKTMKGFLMPRIRSVDIDEELDFKIIDAIVQSMTRKKENKNER